MADTTTAPDRPGAFRERVLLAAAVGAAGLLVAGALLSGADVFDGDALLVLCTSALALEVLVATAALALALPLRAPLRATLGLGRGALTWRELLVLVAGTLAANVDVMLGNEVDFTACLGFEVEGVDDNLTDLETASFEKMIEKAQAFDVSRIDPSQISASG